MTNKRKDAAALFELLDNSSLRVPKNAGSLKIPAWWKSIDNPSPERIDATPENGRATAVADAAPRRAVMKAAAPSTPATPAKAAAAAPGDEPRRRLFEPPPTGYAPTAAPSIRPPGVGMSTLAAPTVVPPEASASAAPVSPAADPVPVAPVAASTLTPPVMPVAASPATSSAAAAPAVEESVAPRDPRIFTAQTYAQKRRQWVTPRPGAFARLPRWVLPTGLGVIALLIAGTMLAAHHRDNKAGAAVPSDHPTAADAARAAAANVPGPSAVSQYTPVPVPRGDKPGRVFDPGQVTRTADQYYIVIARSPSKPAAEKSAQFLAAHGIDISVEVDVSTGLNVLISVQGFPSTTAAKPYKDRIIEIGHLTAEYKKSGRAWDDAAVLNGIRTVAQ